MGDISKGQGRTVLFVSHNMASVKLLCNQSLLLGNGMLQNKGQTDFIINQYKKLYGGKTNPIPDFNLENEFFILKEIFCENENKTDSISINNEVHITLIFDFKTDISGVAFELFMKNDDDTLVFSNFTKTMSIKKGISKVECVIPRNFLNCEVYTFSVGVSKNYTFFLAKYDAIISIDVEDHINELGWQGKVEGVVRPKLTWHHNQEII